MSFERRSGCEYSAGIITGADSGRQFFVTLDDGCEVIAVLGESARHKAGCLFGDLAGHRVTVVHRPEPKPPLIVDLVNPALDA